jgi:hypothetical protein
MREFRTSGNGEHPITGLMESDWLWGVGEANVFEDRPF